MIGTSKFVVGKNNGWKQKVKMWKKTKQSFAYVPYEYFIGCLERRCRELSIEFLTTEESYTSKASLSDLDKMPVWDGKEKRGSHDKEFSGKRTKRGLYRDSKGRLFNADVNASGNVLRKVIPNAFARVKSFKYLMNPKRVRLGVFAGDETSMEKMLVQIKECVNTLKARQK